MKNLSIRTKLLVAILAVAAANGLFAVLFFPEQERQMAERSFTGEVESLARTVALGIGIGMETGDLSGVQKSMDFAKANEDVRFVYLESDGEKLASFPEEFELTDDVLATDTLLVGEAPIESEALDGRILIGASTVGLRADIAGLRRVAVGVAVLLIGFGGLAAFWLARLIVTPIRGAQARIEALARGQLEESEDDGREDEVGQMTRSLNRAVIGIRGALETDEVDWDEITEQRRREAHLRQAEAERIERERREAAELQRRVDRILEVVGTASSGDLTGRVDLEGDGAVERIGRGLNDLIGQLRESISSLADSARTLGGASHDLTDVTGRIGDEASSTLSRARNASDAADMVSDNVRSVAAATEEMTSTVREIARNAAHAAEVARGAVGTAEDTNRTMSALSDSSVEIGSVVKVIQAIAERTNLLALNATIEAARAGDAGKGFAVVAHEVKELAGQSARAAQEIGDKVTAIQSDSAAAATALGSITRIIAEIDDIQGTIAAAVEEQTATTQEIGRSLEATASAAEEISGTIRGLADAAQSTSDGVGKALASVGELDGMSARLTELVGRFRIDS